VNDELGGNIQFFVKDVVESSHNKIISANFDDVEINGNVKILNNHTLTINDYTFPAKKGGAGQVLKTDDAGNVTWQSDNIGDYDTNYYTDSAELDKDNLLTFTRVGDSGTYSVDLSSLNVESIWSPNAGTATYDGHIVVDSLSTFWDNPNAGGRDNTRILNPKGGSYSNESSASTGSIIITLPQGRNGSMLSMSVKIYDYAFNEHKIINVSGYLYSSASHGWHNGSVWIDNNPKYSHNLTVWLGYDAELEKCVVIIGEKTSTWGYLDVNVTDVQIGHTNQQPNKWNEGWDIELSEDWDTATYGETLSPKYSTNDLTNKNNASKFINTQANNWYRSDDDTVECDEGAIAKSFITKGSSNRRILSPEGADFYSDSDVEGAFIIELPHDDSWATNAHTNGPWTDTHISLTAKIYDYWADEHITLNISGYNYHGGNPNSDPTTGQWARTSAWIEGNPKDEHNFKVRFAYEKGLTGPGGSSGKCVIIIGEKDSTWNKPKLYVTDLQVAGSNSNESWHKGWNVIFSNDWDVQTIPIFPRPAYGDSTEPKYAVTATVENTQAHNWARNGDNIEYNGGTVKINDYTLPAADGSDGQVLKTDGDGTTSWGSASGRRNPKKSHVDFMNFAAHTGSNHFPRRYYTDSQNDDCRLIEPNDVIIIDTGNFKDVSSQTGVRNEGDVTVELNLPPISNASCDNLEFQSGDIVTVKNSGGDMSIGVTTLSTSRLIDGIETQDSTGQGPWIKITPNTSVTFMYSVHTSNNGTVTKEWFIIESHQIISFYPSRSGEG
jgi:hypothetical protein